MGSTLNNGIDGHIHQYIVMTTKGIEFITVHEIKKKFPEAEIIEKFPKRIIISLRSGREEELTHLRTADDVHMLLDYIINIDDLNENYIVNNLPIDKMLHAYDEIKHSRSLQETFSLTISRYLSDINLESLKELICERIILKTPLKYTERDHSNFDIRIHIEESSVSYSCKIPANSLYLRPYKVCQMAGSLKPPVAASLLLLLHPKSNERIVDNFCGTGTFLCEAYYMGLEPFGGDINPDMVECAQKNMKNVSKECVNNIKLLDATKTKWPDAHFNYAISNFPWGKQVKMSGAVRLYSSSIAEYARILKKDGSIALIGMKPELIVKHLKIHFPHHKINQFKVGFLGQTPTVVFAYPPAREGLYEDY